MLSLIGSALGLFSSAIPKVLNMWQDKNDKAHELALLKAQAEITLDQTAIEQPYCHMEKLLKLEQLPPHGFTVACFPWKIKGASGGCVRAVAMFD